MNYFTKEDLISKVGNLTDLIELKLNEERSVVISRYGGRLLGIFPSNENYNYLWINPDIEQVMKANEFRVGGDRYWISPERDYFYEKPETFEGWFCPKGLDPANYEVLGDSKTTCTLSSKISIINQVKKIRYMGEVTRQFTVVKEPISTGVQNIGIEYVDDCVIFAPNVKMNGWSIAQVITGGVDNPGTVLIPTKSNPKPLSYFRIIPEDRFTIGDNYVAYKIDADDIYKLAIRPEDINFERPAKIGYFIKVPDSDKYGFLVKLSDDIPKIQSECFDVARDRPDEEVGVIQSYNANSPDKPSLNFGEIELQLNAFKTIDNTSLGKAKHQLISYIGTKEEILKVIEKYLGIENPKLFYN